MIETTGNAYGPKPESVTGIRWNATGKGKWTWTQVKR